MLIVTNSYRHFVTGRNMEIMAIISAIIMISFFQSLDPNKALLNGFFLSWMHETVVKFTCHKP